MKPRVIIADNGVVGVQVVIDGTPTNAWLGNSADVESINYYRLSTDDDTKFLLAFRVPTAVDETVMWYPVEAELPT